MTPELLPTGRNLQRDQAHTVTNLKVMGGLGGLRGPEGYRLNVVFTFKHMIAQPRSRKWRHMVPQASGTRRATERPLLAPLRRLIEVLHSSADSDHVTGPVM